MILAGNKLYKPILVLVMIALLAAVSQIQDSLNQERVEYGLTRLDPLENAPPVLAFTTVALGGFRGLIANGLWMRAMELQDQGKYFEMVQLADWITKLQPYFSMVWVVQAWNMSYNISVKLDNHEDRWEWVQRGIELLRDDGLRYNPKDTLIFRELAWHFQHKMGHNLDDAHMTYKIRWADRMTDLLGDPPDYSPLLNPQTDEQRERLRRLREDYKMDPGWMRHVDERYGPLEWRLPESHAIYWASKGLEHAREGDPNLMQLRRAVYQSMQLARQRGRLIKNLAEGVFEFGPNLEIIPNVSRSYLEMMEQEPDMREHIQRAHRNTLIDSVGILYTHNRQSEARKWFDYLRENYGDYFEIVYGEEEARGLTLDHFVVDRITEQVADGGVDAMQAMIEGFLWSSFYYLAIGEHSQADGYNRLAHRSWLRHMDKVKRGTPGRVDLPPMENIRRKVLGDVLHPERGFSPAAAARLRTELNLPADAFRPEQRPTEG